VQTEELGGGVGVAARVLVALELWEGGGWWRDWRGVVWMGSRPFAPAVLRLSLTVVLDSAMIKPPELFPCTALGHT
jgi:hypothetical protein